MQDLPLSYLVELAKQFSFVSAFLGGFAAAFLATLISQKSTGKPVKLAIHSSALAACSFIVAVSAFTMLSMVARPDTPDYVMDQSSVLRARIIGFLAFIIGNYAILFAMGTSGWLYNKRAGIYTTIFASISAILVSWMILGL